MKTLFAKNYAIAAALLALNLFNVSEATCQHVKQTGDLNVKRIFHQFQPLGNGKAIAFGGQTVDSLFQPVWHSSCEIFDSLTEVWSMAASMNTPRSKFASVITQGGKILAIGGITANATVLSSVESYDPLLNIWTTVGSMSTTRQQCDAILLDNGDILVIGGNINDYDVGSSDGSSWALGGTVPIGYRVPEDPQVIRMNDSRILVAGNQPGAYPNWALTITQGLTPDTTDTPLTEDHPIAGLALLVNGNALITNGTANGINDLFNPTNNNCTQTGSFVHEHYGCPLIPLLDGRVVAINMGSTNYPSGDTEILEVYDTVAGTWQVIMGHNFTATQHHKVAALGNGQYLIAGGAELNQVITAGARKCFIFDEFGQGTGIEETTLSLVQMFYNSTNHTINIKLNENSGNAKHQAYLYDIAGKLINQYSIIQSETSILIPRLSAGLYMMQVVDETNHNSVSGKFLIE